MLPESFAAPLLVRAQNSTGPFDRGRPVDAGPVTAAELGGLATALGLFVLFAAVFYAMLVYAPRQIAEPEGTP